MNTITIMPEGKKVSFEVDSGKSLLNILLDNQLILESPCKGMGTCGKCKVKILEGIWPTGKNDVASLKESELAWGYRLACTVKPIGDIVIEINSLQQKHKVLTSGYVPKFDLQPSIEKCICTLKKPTIENQESFENVFSKMTNSHIDDMAQPVDN